MSRPQGSAGGGQSPDDDAEGVRRDLLDAAPLREEERTVIETMRAQGGFTTEDELKALRILWGVRAGSAVDGYGFARIEGKSRGEARARPATAALLAAAEVLGPDGHTGGRADAYQAALEAALRRHDES